jgi:hypothetical protein
VLIAPGLADGGQDLLKDPALEYFGRWQFARYDEAEHVGLGENSDPLKATCGGKGVVFYRPLAVLLDCAFRVGVTEDVSNVLADKPRLLVDYDDADRCRAEIESERVWSVRERASGCSHGKASFCAIRHRSLRPRRVTATEQGWSTGQKETGTP